MSAPLRLPQPYPWEQWAADMRAIEHAEWLDEPPGGRADDDLDLYASDDYETALTRGWD